MEEEVYEGENQPQWNGGEFPYGSGWNDSKKKAVRERDDYQCQICELTQEEHREEYGRALSVHHIVPARQFDEGDPTKNEKENLVSLCQPCHQKWEASRFGQRQPAKLHLQLDSSNQSIGSHYPIHGIREPQAVYGGISTKISRSP